MRTQSHFLFSQHFISSWLLLVVMLIMSPQLMAETFHHELRVDLDAEQSTIAVTDTMKFGSERQTLVFFLHSDFRVTTEDAKIHLLDHNPKEKLNTYELRKKDRFDEIKLAYEGRLEQAEDLGLFGMPKYIVSPDTLYLDGSSFWYPRVANNASFSFELSLNQFPDNWEVISQGKREKKGNVIRYVMPHAQTDIYLLGGRFKRFTGQHGETELEVYLLEDDPELANQYLSASGHYLDMYSDWIGTYPYAKFSVIENEWQTGYGMPSFTLLGSRVLRLPFILYTSLPHEILHNWWGNGVYVDYQAGNWSEGLTAYMADHLSSQQRGRAADYRRKALERYANFAAEENDFPLVAFRSRHNDASQAVGYSKSLMIFHMLRMQLGEDLFNRNLKTVWEKYRFRKLGFRELIMSMVSGSEINAKAFHEKWITQPGAPEIQLVKARLFETDNDILLRLDLAQLQSGEAYDIHLPVKVEFEDGESKKEMLNFTQKQQIFEFIYQDKPAVVKVDPDFDVFRLLDDSERPASLGRFFSAKKLILVYPESSTVEQKKAWQHLAESWHKRFGNVSLITDAQFKNGHQEKAVVLLGWDNKGLVKVKKRFSSGKQELREGEVRIAGKLYTQRQHAVLLMDNDNRRPPLGFIGASKPKTITALARKLTHYSSYGRLVFSGDEVSNSLKQTIDVQHSVLVTKVN